MAELTTTTSAVFIPELWSNNLIITREANLVAGSVVNHDYDGEISQYGDTVHVQSISDFTVGDKTEGTDVTFEALTETNTDILINKWKFAAFKLNDLVDTQSKQNLREKYSAKLGYALAKQLDDDIMLEYANAGSIVGTTGTDVTDANFLTAIQKLDDADVPDDGRRSFVISPKQKRAMLLIEKFVRADWSGRTGQSNPIITGKFGMLYNIDIYVTTQVFTHGSPVTEHNLLLHSDGITLAKQAGVRIQADYNIRSLATEVVADCIYGVKTMRADHVVDFQT